MSMEIDDNEPQRLRPEQDKELKEVMAHVEDRSRDAG